MADLTFVDPGNSGGSIEIPESPAFVARPVVYICPRCKKEFGSNDDRSQHFFSEHPYQRPVLFLRGMELTDPRLIVTEPTMAQDWLLAHAEEIKLDGRVVSQSILGRKLSGLRQGYAIVDVTRFGTALRYEISFEVPEDNDLVGIDDCFNRVIPGAPLTVELINLFVDASKEYRTATRYLDGIAHYLYGVLAKDQRGGTQLPHSDFKSRFNQAAQALQYVRRPLSKGIDGIICFNLNRFEGPAALNEVPVLANSSRFFLTQIDTQEREVATHSGSGTLLPLDRSTDQLLKWCSTPVKDLVLDREAIEAAAHSAVWTADDRDKASVLLGALYRHEAETELLYQDARSLRHHSIFGAWAERVLAEKGQ